MPSDEPSQDYVFGNDLNSSVRLNYQHFLVRQQIGFLLHPEITVNKPNLRIADIGAGTCIWLLELAHEAPSAQLDAFDVSSAQYPSQEWLPNNMSLHVHNAFSPFSQEFLGVYDIVHIQMFITIIEKNDPGPLIRNLMTLLKPGGHLQWLEPDSASIRLISPTEPSKSTAASTQLQNFMKNALAGRPFGWASHLDSAFAQQGLAAIKFDRHMIDRKFTPFWNESKLLTVADFIKTALAGDSEKAQQLRELLKRVAVEFRSGAGLTSDLVLALGRKPLEG